MITQQRAYQANAHHQREDQILQTLVKPQVIDIDFRQTGGAWIS